MPTLLNVNNYHYRRGGAEVVYLGHGEMFAEHGWDIDWFSMKHPQNLPGTNERYFAELIDLEHMHGTVAKLRAAAAIVYNANAQSRIGTLVDAHRPDIAHLHNIYHHLSPSVLIALKRRDIPTVLTAHDLKLACPNYKMLSNGLVCERCRGGRVWNVATHNCMKGSRALSGLIAVESAVHKSLRLYASNTDRIVAPSRFYRAKLIEWGWPVEQVVYIPNFTPNSWEETKVPDNGGVLYFGRLSEEKGVSTLIRASALSKVSVVIAGTGPAAAQLHALAHELSAPVEFVGHCAGSALESLFHRTRAVALPSEWYENSPMSILEAYSAGRPVIGADIGGIPEMIRNGETGWIVSSGDIDALAEKLIAVNATSSAELSEMGHTGSRFAHEYFSKERYLLNMTKLYDSLGVKA